MGAEESQKAPQPHEELARDLDVLVIVGSPNPDGRSAALSRLLDATLQAEGIRPCVFPLYQHPVAACTGCCHCQETGSCVIVNDGWGVLSRHMESADLVFVIAPVFFAGPSAYLKAALDRCQMYWSRRYVLHEDPPADTPTHLIVLGEGGDPFGFTPLVEICRSALNNVGLRIEDRVHDMTADKYDTAQLPALVATALEELS